MLRVVLCRMPSRLLRLRMLGADTALGCSYRGPSARRSLSAGTVKLGESTRLLGGENDEGGSATALAAASSSSLHSEKYIEKKYVSNSSFTAQDFDTLAHIKNLNHAISSNVSMDDVSSSRARTLGLAKTRRYFMENKDKLYVQNIATLFKAIISSNTFQFQSRQSTFYIDDEWLSSIIATLRFNIEGNPLNDPSFKSMKNSKQIATLMFGLPIIERASLSNKVALMDCVNLLLRMEGVQLGPDSIALCFNGLRNMDRTVFLKSPIVTSLWYCLDKCNMEMTPQEISMTLAGFNRFELRIPYVKQVVSAVAAKVKMCSQQFSAQAISVSLCGLQNFANSEDCVISLLKEIAGRLVISEGIFNSIAISNGYFGLQKMSLDRPIHLHRILDSLAEKIRGSPDGYDKVSVGKSMIGLGSMDLSSPLLEKSVEEITGAIARSQEIYEGDQLAMCLYGYKATPSLNDASEGLLRAIGDKLQRASSREDSRPFTKRHIAMSFSGLRSLDASSFEIRRVLSYLTSHVRETFPAETVMEDSYLAGIVSGMGCMHLHYAEVRELTRLLVERGLSPLVVQNGLSVNSFRRWCELLSTNSTSSAPDELVETIRARLHTFLDTVDKRVLLLHQSANVYVDILASFQDVKKEEALVTKLIDKLTGIHDLFEWGEYRAFAILTHMVSFEPFKYQPQKYIERLIERCGESREKHSAAFLKQVMTLSQEREVSYSVLEFAKKQISLPSSKEKYPTKRVLHMFFLPLAKHCCDTAELPRKTPVSDAIMSKLNSQFRQASLGGLVEAGYVKVQLESCIRKYEERRM